jgi:hypothetical protein
MQYFKVHTISKQITQEDIGFLYGEADQIKKYYADRGVKVILTSIDATDEEGNLFEEEKSPSYRESLYYWWRGTCILAWNREKAIKGCKKYAVRMGKGFSEEEENIVPVTVYKCDMVAGKLQIV